MTLNDAIVALGTTSEEIANKLRQLGIKGYRRRARACPIATYLAACGYHDAYVGAGVSMYDSTNPLSDYTEVYVSLPPVVQQWARDFDDGKFPEFEATTQPIKL